MQQRFMSWNATSLSISYKAFSGLQVEHKSNIYKFQQKTVKFCN